MKKFISGFLCAAVLFSVMPIKAAIEEFLCYRADYKVMVNGAEYVSEELPILNYKGYTYAPFRSILEAAGLDVNWNTELNQAEVSSATITNKEATNMSVQTSPAPTPIVFKKTEDGLDILAYDNEEYVSVSAIIFKCDSLKLMFKQKGNQESWTLIGTEGNILLDSIPSKQIYGHSRILVSYYVSTILPLLK